MTASKAPASESADSADRIRIPRELIDRAAGCPFDPAPAMTRLGSGAPVHPIALVGGERAFVVTGFDEACAVLTDPRFSSASRFATEDMDEELAARLNDEKARAGMFITMDPPEHGRYRRLLTGQFTVRHMRALEPRVLAIVTEHIDAMLAAGAPADLVTDFALPVPSLVICELLGVPYSRRAEFQSRTARLLSLNTSIEQLLQLRDENQRFMLDLIADKRTDPGEDLISGLLAETVDPALSDLELANIANLLLVAGHETTANMLALGTFALLENPAQLAALRADPELMPTAVEELLRYLSIIHIGPVRRATADVDLGGVTVPAGRMVFVSTPEANRADEHWADPRALDVTRPRTRHLAFGYGIHQCLGQQLARIEMITGFTELLRRLPDLALAVPATEVPLRTDMAIFGVHSLPVTWTESRA